MKKESELVKFIRAMEAARQKAKAKHLAKLEAERRKTDTTSAKTMYFKDIV